jgi:hypothetical protein
MPQKVKVNELLAGVGKAMQEAQDSIRRQALERAPQGEELPTTFSISEAEIEVRMLPSEDGAGFYPVAGETDRRALNPGLLSVFKARLIAVPDEAPPRASRKPGEVKAEVLGRRDLAALEKVFGSLNVKTLYSASAGRWLVDVETPDGQLLRRLQVDDSPAAG